MPPRIVACPHCGEHFTPPAPSKARRVTRYVPNDARFVSWLNARGGSAPLGAIARRFNLTAAERDVLVGRYTGARDALVRVNHGPGGGFRFFLLRMPRTLRLRSGDALSS